MSSTKQRGDKAEDQVKIILEKQGCVVFKAQRTMKRVWTKKGIMFISQANDIYGLFDVISKDPVDKYTFYIQVKSTAPHVSTIKPRIAEFADKYGNIYDSFSIWQKVSRRGFIVHKYDHADTKQWIKTFVDFKGRIVDGFNKC